MGFSILLLVMGLQGIVVMVFPLPQHLWIFHRAFRLMPAVMFT